MKNTLGLIDGLAKEHIQMEQTADLIQQVLNNMAGEERIEEKEDRFVPGHYLKQFKMLSKAEQAITELDTALQAHITREERALVEALSHFSSEVAQGLKHISREHRVIRARLKDMQKMLGELISGKLSQAKWRSQAWDLRACAARTAQFLKEHIEKEEALYQRARQDLAKGTEAEV